MVITLGLKSKNDASVYEPYCENYEHPSTISISLRALEFNDVLICYFSILLLLFLLLDIEQTIHVKKATSPHKLMTNSDICLV